MTDNKPQESAEIQPRPHATVTKRPSQAFVEYAMRRAEMDREYIIEELGAQQLDAILSAESEEELWTAMEIAGLTGLRDIDNSTELRINSMHFMPGMREDFRNRFGIFAVLDAQFISNGQEIKLDTGVERIITFVRSMEAHEWMPIECVVIKVSTGGGNEMITLKPLPKRAVHGKTQ